MSLYNYMNDTDNNVLQEVMYIQNKTIKQQDNLINNLENKVKRFKNMYEQLDKKYKKKIKQYKDLEKSVNLKEKDIEIDKLKTQVDHLIDILYKMKLNSKNTDINTKLKDNINNKLDINSETKDNLKLKDNDVNNHKINNNNEKIISYKSSNSIFNNSTNITHPQSMCLITELKNKLKEKKYQIN